MYLADCHNHTCCSKDSKAPLSAMAQAAAKAGLSLLCTTDHLDLLGWHGEPLGDWDWTPILEQYESALASCPKGLDLRLGIELGAAQFYPERAKDIVKDIPLDLIIGSAHNVAMELGGEDFYFFNYNSIQICHQALDSYFSSLYQLAGMDQIDVIGHIIYPLRYMKRDGFDISLEPYYDTLRAILTRAVDHGRGIEVNTNRGKDVDAWRPVLEFYRQAGGDIVTLGTDAHEAQHVGLGIKDAAELLKELGFRYHTVFRRRKPEFIPL